MLKITTTTGPVWINPAHVVWFWDYRDGHCHVAMIGREDMFTLDTMSAGEFAAMLNSLNDSPC